MGAASFAGAILRREERPRTIFCMAVAAVSAWSGLGSGLGSGFGFGLGFGLMLGLGLG